MDYYDWLDSLEFPEWLTHTDAFWRFYHACGWCRLLNEEWHDAYKDAQ